MICALICRPKLHVCKRCSLDLLTHNSLIVSYYSTTDLGSALMLILHHYWPSPFAHKIRMAMGLADLNWCSVEIPRVPPKPLLTPLTAGYRRTPVLQIGADVFCDTHNIARTLDQQSVHGRLFPSEGAAGISLLSDWVDQQLFPLAARVVITSALDTAPPEFVKDRGDLYFGSGWSVEQLRAEFSGVLLQLRAGLRVLDRSVQGRQWSSSLDLHYGDVAVAFLCWFIRGRWDFGPALLDDYPHLSRIESAMTAIGHGSVTDLDAESALKVAQEAVPRSDIGIHVPTEFEIGQSIAIRPFLPSSDPAVYGKLRYLDDARISIDYDHPAVGAVAVHFPVLGYQITADAR